MTGIGPEFLKLLRGIEWDTLTARDAVELRAALKEGLEKADAWFGKMAREFGASGIADVYDPPQQPPPAAKMDVGRPQVKVSPPRVPKPGASTKRKRGRPQPKARPNPIVIGGANASTGEGPRPAQIFENSYISKEGPRADVPATLPADHPRLNIHRESSVTPEVDVQDFREVERALASGRGVKDIFQVR